MEAYQEQYLANIREIAALSDDDRNTGADFESWYQERLRADRRIAELRAQNMRLLNEHLFPVIDQVFSASDETLAGLEAFADQLMDWKSNLDCGLYVVIHKALLSLHRIRRHRDGTIMELYKLGMGYYYLHLNVASMKVNSVRALNFRNEMLFTEAASYFRFFEEIPREETRGYIIRAMANIALCTKDRKKKIATGIRILNIVQDPYYRSLAPGLPWDVFVRRTHQQMSANRNELSAGDLNRDELAAVLDSCYVVFNQQQAEEHPSVRWLWPLYEMEYSCGYVDAETTLERLEKLITQTPTDEYDMSAMYGSVQLPLYYSHMLRDHPRLADDPLRLRFMAYASGRLERMLTECPPDRFDTYFFYLIRETVSEYVEFPGCVTYLDLTRKLFQRFAGPLYIEGCKAGRMMRLLCGEMLRRFPDYFDDLPVLRPEDSGPAKEKALLDYAEGCGFYHDFGLLKLNIARTLRARDLFEDEQVIYQLHGLSGWEDLKSRPSTRRYADIALGHHAWYNGTDGYPEEYQRNASPYRQMTDLAALVSWLQERADTPMDRLVREACEAEGTRFSPRVAAVFSEPQVASGLEGILRGDDTGLYRTIWQEWHSA